MKVDYFSSLVLRTSLFSLNYLEHILAQTDDAWVEEQLNNPVLMNAIFTASPSFHSLLLNYKNTPEKQRLRITFLNYIARASTRTIPFGLFSGVGLMPLNTNATAPNLPFKIDKKYFTQYPDSALLAQFIEKVNANNSVKKHLRYYPNTTLYTSNNEYRYMEYELTENLERSFFISEVKVNTYLKKIIQSSETGAYYHELIHYLLKQGFEQEESEQFIHELIHSRFIVSELQLSTIGFNEVKQLFAVLERVEEKDEELTLIYNTLQSIGKLLKNNETDVNNLNNNSIEEQQLLLKIAPGVKGSLFNQNLFIQSSSSFDASLLKQVEKAHKLLSALSSAIKSNTTRFDAFKNAFFNRYGYAVVKVMDVMDAELGTGYDYTLNSFGEDANHLIQQFPFARKETPVTLSLNAIDQFLAKKIQQALEGKTSVELNTSEIANLLQHLEQQNNKTETHSINTGCVRFNLFHTADLKPIIYINSVSYASPNTIMARFTHNEAFKAFAEEIQQEEDNGFQNHELIAEVDYLPNAAFGNTLKRAIARPYVISCYAGVSYADKINIPLSDLYMYYHDEEIVLISKKLNRKIIPFFTTAMNDDYPNILPVFKFLFDLHLQYESNKVNVLNVDKFHAVFKHIPRISANNIVLSKATSTITHKDVQQLNPDDPDLLNKFKIQWDELRLPSSFVICERDIEMLIDSTNKDAIVHFLSELKKKKKLTIKEFLPHQFKSVVKDKEENSYCSEFFLPFKLKQETRSTPTGIRKVTEKSIVPELLFPSGEWLYFKLYTGYNTADKVMKLLHEPLTNFITSGLLDSYFFIKYSENGYHIRLRLKLSQLKYHKKVFTYFNRLFATYTSQGLLNTIQLEVYKRELERYDFEHIVVFERLFYHDSALCLELLKRQGNTDKWLFSLIIFEQYANAFQMSLKEKVDFTDLLANQFSVEFGSNKDTKKFISAKYSLCEQAIKNYFQNYSVSDTAIYFHHFSQNIKTEIALFKSLSSDKKIHYLNNLFHMHIIRLMGAKNNRLYEFMLYTFLSRYYKEIFYTQRNKNSEII